MAADGFSPHDTPFAVDRRGGETLYVRLDAVAVPVEIVLLCGMEVMFPHGEDTPYLPVRDALRLYRLAVRSGNDDARPMLRVLRKAMKAFGDGDVEVVE